MSLMKDASIFSSSVASEEELMRGSLTASSEPGTIESYRAAMNFRICERDQHISPLTVFGTHSVDKVAEIVEQFAVVSRDELVPGKDRVGGFRTVHEEVVSPDRG